MPCMGPDCNYARERSIKLYDEVVKILEEKYDVKQSNGWGVFKEDTDKQFKQLKKTLEEIFVLDACSGF